MINIKILNLNMIQSKFSPEVLEKISLLSNLNKKQQDRLIDL